MILPNITNFEFPSTNSRETYLNLIQHVTVGSEPGEPLVTAHKSINGCVMICPTLNNMYTYWLPTGSMGDHVGQTWSKLHYIIEIEGDTSVRRSVWDGGCESDIKTIIDNQYPCYIVNMSDMYYRTMNTIPLNLDYDELNNKEYRVFDYSIYIKNEDDYFRTNMYELNNGDLYVVRAELREGQNYYALSDNSIKGYSEWGPMDHNDNWNDWCYQDTLPISPHDTIDTSICEGNTMDYVEEGVIDGEHPSIHVTSDSGEPDELRQDLDGEWYTRLELYDWYGSHEAWTNLDPHMYHSKRYDEHSDCWSTKEEMFQWYGSNSMWKKMKPKKQITRNRLCAVYSWATYLPPILQHSFIHAYMKTY